MLKKNPFDPCASVRDFLIIWLILSRCRIGEAGFAAHSFDFKGVVQTKITEESVDIEAATEAAIEAGAEDVEETTNDDEEKVLQVISRTCDKIE